MKLYKAKKLTKTYETKNALLVEKVIELESELGWARTKLER